jgi:hypothetical protein
MPWYSSTRVRPRSSTVSTSGFTLFIMSSCIAALTMPLHSSHTTSGRAPSAALASALFTSFPTAADAYGLCFA